jgi:hypothetical protein
VNRSTIFDEGLISLRDWAAGVVPADSVPAADRPLISALEAALPIVLAEHGQPNYRHYGEFGVYLRAARWEPQLPLLEQHWRAFLESDSADAGARERALTAIAERLP